jgi:GH35 family endo-1,4-beta-xylanase
MYGWDIVNEINNPNSFLSQEQVLELARAASAAAKAADPQTLRIFNANLPLGDHLATPQIGQFAQRDGVKTAYRFFSDLARAGVDYDLIGIQMYYWGLDLMELSRMLDRFARFGKPIQISEIGIASQPGVDKKSPYFQDKQIIESLGQWHAPWSEKIQADYAEGIYTIAYSKPAVTAITWWDFTDDFWPFGGLLQRDGTPKEAYRRIKELLQSWGFHGK